MASKLRLEFELMVAKVDKIYEILTGNGDPEKGLAYKVARHGEHVAFWQKFGWQVLTAIFAVATGVSTAVIVFILKNGALAAH